MRSKGEWNLKKIISNKQQFYDYINKLNIELNKFQKFKNNLNNDTSLSEFIAIIHALEKINEIDKILFQYGSLKYAEDIQSSENLSIKTLVTRLHAEVLNKTEFFYDWWKTSINSKKAKSFMNSTNNLSYFLEHTRELSKYYLSEPKEQLINTLSSTGASALIKLYTNITNKFEYGLEFNGKTKSSTKEEIQNIIRTSSNANTREKAYTSFLSVYNQNSLVLGDIYQNLVLNYKDTCIDLRKYKSPISVKTTRDGIDDEVINAMLSSCKSNVYLFRKFFKIKAKELGMKKLRRYDLYAPIKSISTQKYTYAYASKIILSSWKNFNPSLHSFGRTVLCENNIDYGLRKNKKSGAFCAGIIPSMSPYISLSYKNNLESVLTLAHELGHAIHYVAASKNSILSIRATTPISETASTFSETLVLESLLKENNSENIKYLIFSQIEEYYAAIMRQAYITLFEIDAHEKISSGTTISDLNKLYLTNLKEQFGNSLSISKNFEVEWMSIPHIYNTPFYCYSYVFGSLLSLALLNKYNEEGNSFSKSYAKMLSEGGSKSPQKLLNECGLDITSKKTWDTGFDYISTKINMLKSMIN